MKDCALKTHSAHNCLFLSQAIEQTQKTIQQLSSSLKECQQELQLSLLTIQHLQKTTNSSAQSSKNSIMESFLEIRKALDGRKFELFEEVESAQKNKLYLLQQYQERIETKISNLVKQEHNLTTQSTQTNDTEFETLQKLNCISKDLETSIVEARNENNNPQNQPFREEDFEISFSFDTKEILHAIKNDFGRLNILDIQHCTIRNLLSEIVIGDKICFQVELRNEKGEAIESTSTVIGVHFEREAQTNSFITLKSAQISIENRGLGLYEIELIADSPGKHRITPLINGNPILGSPFFTVVLPKVWSFDFQYCTPLDRLQLTPNERKITFVESLSSSLASSLPPYESPSSYSFGFAPSYDPRNASTESAYILGSVGFSGATHRWRVKINSHSHNDYLWVALGVANRPLLPPNYSNQIHDQLQACEYAWCWVSNGFKFIPSDPQRNKTSAPVGGLEPWQRGDILSFFLDCEAQVLTMTNERNNTTDSIRFSSKLVFPFFSLGVVGNSVTLLP
jgi:hypothetical protein